MNPHTLIDLLLPEPGAPLIHTPQEEFLKSPPRVKVRLYVVHTSVLPVKCELRVTLTGTMRTIRLDELTSKTHEVEDNAKKNLSYAPNIEVLATARIAALRVKDIIVPTSRRRDVLRIIWADASIEKEQQKSGMPFIPNEQMTQVQNIKAHKTKWRFTSVEDVTYQITNGDVWYTGDWSEPQSLQPNCMLTEHTQEFVASRTGLLYNPNTHYRLCQMLLINVEKWTWPMLQEKAVYHSLNMFKADVSKLLSGDGWVIAESVDALRATVNKSYINMNMAIPLLIDQVPKPWPTPPTHFTTNKSTHGYQEFLNTYGLPRYREVNPALFTAVIFSFLFGVLSRDMGHALFLFSAGLYLLWNETANDTAKLGELSAGMPAERYMIPLVIFFNVSSGFIYDACLSLGLNLFGCRRYFYGQDNMAAQSGAEDIQTAPYGNPASVSPLGLDPIWKIILREMLHLHKHGQQNLPLVCRVLFLPRLHMYPPYKFLYIA